MSFMWLKLYVIHTPPGKLGIVGLPPLAIRMCLPLYTLSPTLIFPSGVKTAWPRIYSTSSCKATNLKRFTVSKTGSTTALCLILGFFHVWSNLPHFFACDLQLTQEILPNIFFLVWPSFLTGDVITTSPDYAIKHEVGGGGNCEMSGRGVPLWH